MKTVEQLIIELSNFPADAKVKFYACGFSGKSGVAESELIIVEYDQDTDGNPTFLLEQKV